MMDNEVVVLTSEDMTKLLFSPGFVICVGDPHTQDNSKKTPIHMAAGNVYDNSEVVDALVNIGSNVNARDYKGRTPLHIAAILHNREITNTLLKYGANPNIPDYFGRMPLHYASIPFSCWNDFEVRLPVAQSLLQNGAHVNYPDNDHETPLMSAIRDGHLGIIKLLLEWGADIHARNNKFETCLHIACKQSMVRDTRGSRLNLDDEIFMQLLKHRACTESFDQNGMTALDLILASEKSWKQKMAEKFVMMAILANNGHWTEFYLSKENPELREFIQECFEEVVRMRTIRSANMSLCDIALRDDSDADENWVTEKSIFDRALETLKNFPIYNAFIENHFHRSYLLEKMSEMNVIALCETGEVSFNSDIIDYISSFLSTKDLLNFLKTFINPIQCNAMEDEKKTTYMENILYS